jgi:NADH dehydrogenase FAD-containing subunit
MLPIVILGGGFAGVLLRRVTISYEIGTLRREISYDHLVLALGSETNYLGIPGIHDHAMELRALAMPSCSEPE